MSLKTARTPAQVLRSRGIGARVGTLIGCGWLVSGLCPLSWAFYVPLGLLGLAAVVPLLGGSSRLIALAKTLPLPDAAAQTANRRAWTLFWINLAVEIALLNLVVALLARPEWHAYWVPAISLVVGLHFLPMASFFAVPSYRNGGAAMIGLAAIGFFAIKSVAAAPLVLVSAEAIGNAIILWSMAAWGLRTAARLTVQGSQPSLRSDC